MDIYQFLASIIESIAWPLTIVIGLFMLKDRIVDILPYVQRIKIKDFEIDLKEAKQEIAKEIGTKSLPSVKSSDQFKDLYLLADLSPRSAILEAWLKVESAASELAVKKVNETPGAMLAVPPLRMGEYLSKQGIISEGEFKFFNRLRELRNKAVHLADMSISLQETIDYIDMSRTLTAQLVGRNEP